MKRVDLFREGYSVEPTRSPGVFRVLRPVSRGGGFYTVNALSDRCNCCARVRCRHRIGLRKLVFAMASALEDEGEYERAAKLLTAWCETLRQRESVERRAA